MHNQSKKPKPTSISMQSFKLFDFHNNPTKQNHQFSRKTPTGTTSELGKFCLGHGLGETRVY